MRRLIWPLSVLYTTLAFLLARRVVVRGWSMYPTLAPGEYVLFDRLAFHRRSPQLGDVVLAAHPGQKRTRLIKRVVALPGQRVVTRNGRLWVSGQPYEGMEAEVTGAEGEWTLGEDEYFLLGDAPAVSTDARHFGPVRRRQILARAWLVYWPPGRMRAVHSGR
ncbi:MAG: signal peptidase I [Dehalococcoidia bacterium]